MRVEKFLLFTILLCSIFGCQFSGPSTSGDNDVESTNSDSNVPVEFIQEEDVLYLEGLIASSSSSEKEIQNLFDYDPSTTWKTKLGTGPREKIEIVFMGEGVELNHLKLGPSTDEQCALIHEITLYIDGTPLVFNNVAEPLTIDTLVKELIIEFTRVGELNTQQFEFGEERVTIGYFPEDKSIGLDFLLIYDRNGAELKLRPPLKIDGRLATSSNLNPLSLYHAGHLFDYKKEFGWIEGAQGSGTGDSILIQLDTSICISTVMLWNGQQSNLEQFEENARVKSLTFRPLEDTSRVFFKLNDQLRPNSLVLNNVTGQNWVLKILEIYPGKVTRDLVIGELLFYTCDNQPFIIRNGLNEQFQNELLTGIEGSILEGYLDKYIMNHVELDSSGESAKKSIILHSNGSFNYFEQVYMPDRQPQVVTKVADGIWGILEANETITKLKIRGSWKINLDGALPIFEEDLILTKSKIEGNQELGMFFTE